MNRATLPIVARLRSLQAAQHFDPDRARVISDVSDVNQLAAMLREMNETVLARSLRFDTGGGSSLTLEVAGRRVLRLAAAEGVSGAESCLAAPALEDELKDELIKLLQAIAVPRQRLRVSSTPLARGSEGLSVGLPVALLADLLLLELNEPETASEPAGLELDEVPHPTGAVEDTGGISAAAGFLGRLAQEIGPVLMAWLIVGGDEGGAADGPEEMVSHLQGFLEDEAEAVGHQLDQVSNQSGTPVCILLGATLVEGHSILCARAGEGILLGVIEGDGTKTLLRAWNAVTKQAG